MASQYPPVTAEAHAGPGAPRAKYWWFTLFHYTGAPDAPEIGMGASPITYLVCQSEVTETGEAHLQGYVEFRKQLRFPQAKAALINAWLEPNGSNDRPLTPCLGKRGGTAAQNIAYCTKDDSYDSDTGIRFEAGAVSVPAAGQHHFILPWQPHPRAQRLARASADAVRPNPWYEDLRRM